MGVWLTREAPEVLGEAMSAWHPVAQNALQAGSSASNLK